MYIHTKQLTVGALLSMVAVIAMDSASASGPRAYIPLGSANGAMALNLESYQVEAVAEGVINSHGSDISPDGQFIVMGSLTPRVVDDAPERPEGVSESDHEAHHGGGTSKEQGDRSDGRLYIIDPDRGKVVRQYDAPGPIHHVDITSDSQHAISTHPMEGGISVISIDSGETMAQIATGPGPNYIVETSDGSSLYVSNSGNGTISEIDTQQWYVRRNIRVGGAPEHMVLDEEEGRLYVNDVDGGRAIAVDQVSGKPIAEYQVGPAPHGLALERKKAVLYATSKGGNELVAIDLKTDRVRRHELDPSPYHAAVNPKDGSLLVSSRKRPILWVIDPTTLTPEREIQLDGIGHQIAIPGR